MADVPGTAVAAVRRYCDNKIPAALRNELRVECSIRGKSITIHECRPPWDGTEDDEGTSADSRPAALRPADQTGSSTCADRNSRWHRYELAPAAAQLRLLLDEIDRDLTGILWG